MKSFKELLEMTLSKRAASVAQDKHHYQYRKFDGEPYFKHPSRVADILRKYTKDEEIISAGYLHDTLEDTKTSWEELEATFGKRVADLVKELTSVKREVTKLGKAEYLLKKMQKMSESALFIKLADRLDNVDDFSKAPDKFRLKYIKETNYILDNLNRKLSRDKLMLVKEIKTRLRVWA